MKYRIYFTHDDHVDSIDISGDSLEEIQEKANREIDARNPDDYWSAEVSG